MTTDVQSVQIDRVVGTSNYSIQCGYVMGSDARGCVYSITGAGVTESGNITRADSEEGVIVELADAACYSEVLVYDWESDGSTGTLPIRVDSNSTIEICPTTTMASSSPGIRMSLNLHTMQWEE